MMSKEIEDGGPAFPQNLPDDFVWRLPGDPGGMSIRDWFAGQALAGVWAGRETDFVRISAPTTTDVSVACYAIADAMLKARNIKHE